MTDRSLWRRKELRIPVKASVHLSGFGEPSCEIASIVDVSGHGAKVLTRRSWEHNQQESIRLSRGTLNCRARVVYCQPYTDNAFTIGIETIGDWTVAERRPGREKSDASPEQLAFIAEVLYELFDLLEQYAPMWYTEEQHNRAVAALSILSRVRKVQ